ncbi:MAG: helix-hairpin-helix domain-containing protein [Candidatus Fermentibacteraceae bacterium]|nr:helix-hairpin-helix domain-containing protein [Candidatus Fermentibacteraceae bacterium]MBN2607557.1 helix-hairpin-helix domain-containing protein [Candidatus Fermentibacteraceae bacterium]
MAKIMAAVLIAALLVSTSRAAFEPVPESPLLQGGIASSLFPRSSLALGLNPVSLALLEGPGIAASASRPYGLRRLDRTALAGSAPLGSCVLGGMLSVTGDETYTEMTADAGFAWKLIPRVAAAVGISVRRLQISGYGRALGASMNASVVWSPAEGIYSTALIRSLARTDLGSSGDPAAPRSLELALGVVPAENVVIALGASDQEGVDLEYSVHTGFSPVPGLALCTGVRTGPARFWAAAEVSLSSLGLQYGYGEHSSLPGTHSIAVSWGSSAFRPEALDLSEDDENGREVVFPLNVNTATEEQLELIPGVGPAKASAIVSWVRMNGPVNSLESLEEVPGIGPSLMRVLREYLVVE